MPTLYHFTDIDNLSAILACGALRCHRNAPTTVDVGNPEIKANRMRRQVRCGLGGMVGDYVPFYFAPRSPMMYVISKGKVDGVSTDLSRLIYFVSTTEIMYGGSLSCVYSDGNAAVLITEFLDDPQALHTHVDLPLMTERMWMSTQEDPDRMRRRMAEFLVHEQVPLEYIQGIVVRSEPVRKRVISLTDQAGENVQTAIRSGWYF